MSPALRAAGLTTEVLGSDHTWGVHDGDSGADRDHVARLLTGPAAPHLAGTASHCCSGDAAAQDAVHALAPDERVRVTECTGTGAAGTTEAQAFADSLYWHSSRVVLPALDHWASAVLEWNLAPDPTGGPHVGGCGTCTGFVTLDGDLARWSGELAVLAHASRFLPRGSVRVGSSSTAANVTQVAFQEPDGAVVVLLHQSGWTTRAVTIDVAGRRFTVPVAP
ncbi:glycoside hydrolase family 30 beta sandwich domain-containing protein [Cellulomonas endophytica]|uniref:glycoside hydrolase family 30 beta sandwich domain-containing protein n=1 Tax=Cellulomonas endophytica TaxID=2494735 RepID=UPI00101197B5|nr:glycoside hydrolase family 30 beta sandwich domain-containing protein [Cellulomonas endophytica]